MGIKKIANMVMGSNCRKLFVVAAAVALVWACGTRGSRKAAETPEAEVYAEYVKAYTGGIVGEDATIRVELAQDAVSMPGDGLFTFKPEVEGTTLWESPTAVTFKPEGLVPGQTYRVSFALNKVIEDSSLTLRMTKGADRKTTGTDRMTNKVPRNFDFGFTVRKQAAEVQEEADTRDGFRVRKATLEESRVEIVMSEAPVNAAKKGMVELQGVARSYVQVEDSLIRVYFEGRKGDMVLTVDKNVKNQKGDTLEEDFQKVFKESGEKPAVQIPVAGNILPDKRNLMLPFKAVNLSAVEVRIVKIYEKNVLMFLQENDLGGSSSLRRCGRLIYKADIPLETEGDLHDWNDHCLYLGNIIKQEPGAIYRVRISFRQDQSLWGGKDAVRSTSAQSGKPTKEDDAVWDTQNPWYWDNDYDWELYNWQDSDNPDTPSYYMDSERFPSITLLGSDIGLVAEYAGGEDLWIAATDLVTARPLGGVTIEAYDYQLQSIGTAKTGGDGLAQIKVAHKPFAVVGRAGGSTAYLKLASERSLSRFDVGGEVLKEGLKAFVYGERGVWRPGDTLHVAAIVQDKGKSLPDGHPATFDVYTPEGQFYTKLVRKSVDGFFWFDIPTRADDPTGYWNAYLKVGSSSFHKTLHVETIKPNRLKIHTSLEDEKVLQAGKAVTIRTTASWLAGGVAGDAPSSARMTLKKAGTSFKGFEGYSFTSPSSNFTSSEYTLYDKKLSSAGELSVNVRMPDATDAPGMLQAFIVTSVQESGGDESFTTASVPFSPFSAYVGVKVPGGDYLETDKDHTISVAVVDALGGRVGGHKVDYVVYKTGWNWWWDCPGGSDLDAWISGSSVKKISGGTVTSGGKDAGIRFRVDYPEWGRYLVLARDVTSGHVSGQLFYVDWPEYRGRANRQDPEALTMLTFSTSQPSYKVGEKATVYIPASAGGQALVSLENGSGVLDRKWVATSDKDTPYTFNVTPEMAPNFYVHITLVQPYSVTADGLPLRMYGVQRVLVDNPASILEPVVKLPDVIRPEEKFTVKVSEKNGKPMTYTLAIVDEGLLDLTAFKTPNPWAFMYKPEALGVKTWDLYDQVIGAWSGRFATMASVGGDEDAMVSARKDNRFNPVVLYLPPRTLARGTDKLELQLPMYVGSVRVMVIAGHDGAYGCADATVPVQSPLMVIPTLPRALGCGEEVSLPVNVFAMDSGLKEANVEVSVSGPVELVGAASQKVAFEAVGDKLIHFGLRALADEGTATVTVQARGGGHKTYETVSLQVSNPNPEVTKVFRYMLAAGAQASVSEGSLLQIAAFPALDAHGLFADMKNYQYNCSEQLSSKGLTYLHMLPMLGSADAAEARELIPSIVSALYARQNADGGFAYWTGGTSSTWVSSMAGHFLVEASKAGFAVNSGVLKAWKGYQEKMSKAFRLAGTSVFTNLDQAYRLYTQVVAGVDATAAMNRLREASDIGFRAQWMLAASYALAGKQQTAGAVIDGIGREFPEYDFDSLTYGGGFRDRMIALDALALCGRVADALALAQESLPSRGLSTQESAFASIAFGHLYGKVPTSAVKASVGGKEVVSAASVVSVPVASACAVENTSDGPLYVTASKTSRSAVSSALANGLAVEVSYLDDDGKALNPASLQQGTRFRAVVKVTNQCARDLSALSLSYGIPSGWEIINDRLSGASDDALWDHKDIRDLRVDWFFGLPAGRYKTFTVQLRAAYEGTYVLPACVASAMYQPAVNGCTASGSAVVTR